MVIGDNEIALRTYLIIVNQIEYFGSDVHANLLVSVDPRGRGVRKTVPEQTSWEKYTRNHHYSSATRRGPGCMTYKESTFPLALSTPSYPP